MGQYGGRDEMYTYLLYSAGRFRRMKEQGEVIFLFYFLLFILWKFRRIGNSLSLTAVSLQFSVFRQQLALLQAMRCILIKHNVPTYRSQREQSKKFSSTNISNNNSFIRSNTAHSSHCESNQNDEQRQCSSVLCLQAVFGDFQGQRNVRYLRLFPESQTTY